MRRAQALPLVVLLALARPAGAVNDHDLVLSRLGDPGSGQAPTPEEQAAIDRFHRLSTELAHATASRPLAPAETLGLAGFDFAIELWATAIHEDQTVGGQRFWVTEDEDPPDTLVVPALRFRKGLPYSLEVGAFVGYVPESSMVPVGGELKLAIQEGFKYIPDFGVRVHAERLVGTRVLDLFQGGFDLLLSKSFGLGGVINLAPYVGYGRQWINAASALVDVDPDYEGPRDDDTCARQPEADPATFDAGDAVCDDRVFPEFEFWKNGFNKWYLGFRFIGNVASAGFEVSLADAVGRHDLLMFSGRVAFDLERR